MKKGCRSTNGTDLQIGDIVLGFGIVVATEPGRHENGARYLDVVFNTGLRRKCWDDFKYHVECDI